MAFLSEMQTRKKLIDKLLADARWKVVPANFKGRLLRGMAWPSKKTRLPKARRIMRCG